LGIDHLDEAKVPTGTLFFNAPPLADQLDGGSKLGCRTPSRGMGCARGIIDAFDKWVRERDGHRQDTAAGISWWLAGQVQVASRRLLAGQDVAGSGLRYPLSSATVPPALQRAPRAGLKVGARMPFRSVSAAAGSGLIQGA